MAWNLCLQADWIHVGIPCNTFSSALRGRTILRSRRFPWGLPDLTSAQSSKVHAANTLVRFLVRLIRMCRRIGKCISVENPASSKLWSNPLLERELYRSKRTTLDYCAFHKPWRKRTIFQVWNSSALVHLNKYRCRLVNGVCQYSGCAHQILSGHAPGGLAWTAVAEAYPTRLCTCLAKHIDDAFDIASLRQHL